MSKPSSGDWIIYRGDNKLRRDWVLPDPPPWRPRRAKSYAPDAGMDRTPLTPNARINGQSYQSTDEIRRVVNAALILRRPMLVTGKPGTGKSTLIDSVAYELGLGEPLRWAVTSRSTLRDALYAYDAIGRVQSVKESGNDRVPEDVGQFVELGALGTSMLPSVRPRALLIDEIDKADADLPNDLLNVLEVGRYHIPELSRLSEPSVTVRTFGGLGSATIDRGVVESFEFPFVVLTSNGERDFPAPFLRRCLQLSMPDPCDDEERLRKIVEAHLGTKKTKDSSLLIQAFAERAKGGEVLATDQLLNAIQLVMGGYAMDEADRRELIKSLTAPLERK